MRPSPGDLVAQVAEFVAARGLLDDVEHVVAACSGGGDSVALVLVLSELCDARRLTLTVATFDHRTGRAMDVELAAARRVAETCGADCVLGHGAAATKDSEAELRRARYQFLVQEARARNGVLATGHTLEDQVETVIMNLARGAGRTGVAGIPARTERDGVTVVRPLLTCGRAAVRQFVTDRGLTWADDPSNLEAKYTRNRVRAGVLPALETAIPGAVQRIGLAAEAIQREEQGIDALLDRRVKSLRLEEPVPGGLALDYELLGREPGEIRGRLVRCALRLVRGHLQEISRDHVGLVDEVIRGVASAVDLPGVRVRHERGKLRFLPLKGRVLAPGKAVSDGPELC